MTRDEIIRMARQAGAHDNGWEVRFVEPRYLERFAALVADRNTALLRQALEALETFQQISDFTPAQAVYAITALRERLGQE